MKTYKPTQKVTRERAKQIILNTEPSLTRQMVDNYSDNELKEWMKQLKIKTNF